MKIAVISDIHDNIWNLDKVVKIIKDQKCKRIMFCGDMCAPFTAERLMKAELKTFTVWGNEDGDSWRIIRKGGENLIPPFDGQDFAEITLDSKRIVITHYPFAAKELVATGYYNAVFYGHSHIARKEVVGKTIFVNPGAVCGIVNGKPGLASFVVYDTETNKIEFIKL